LPKVQGLINSLVGPDPLYGHHGPHLMPAGQLRGPDTHQDSVIDFREDYFDIQLSLFAAYTTDEMGGTFLIPGTHFRNVRISEITIYQHMRGKIWAIWKSAASLITATARRATSTATSSCSA
tara:strand:- start:658 stop:1023 length:366 start_codon:yes stop_codon:yes gene_type:complete